MDQNVVAACQDAQTPHHNNPLNLSRLWFIGIRMLTTTSSMIAIQFEKHLASFIPYTFLSSVVGVQMSRDALQ